MKEINEVTVFMQTRCLSLESCRAALDELIRTIDKYRNTEDSFWHGCTFQSIRTKANSNDLVPNPHFESGVVKLQRGQALDLTDNEKLAVVCLKRPADGEGINPESGNQPHVTSPLSMRQKLQRMKQQRSGSFQSSSCDYINCDFIYGSAAEVERLWSVADQILANNRKGMTPQMFEALIFLKVNKRFWSQSDVCSAMINAKTVMTEKRIKSNIQQAQMFGFSDDEDTHQ